MAAKQKAKKSATAGKTGADGKARTKKGLAKLARMMRGIDLCMMTTQRDRQSFHTRPMSNNGEVEFDGDAWFFSSRDTPKVKELEADDRVSLSYVGGKKKKPIWIAVTGRGSIVDDVDMKQKLWLDELDRWFENGPTDPDVVLIRVKARHAVWWRGEKQGEIVLG
jgi:general stress protein 26